MRLKKHLIKQDIIVASFYDIPSRFTRETGERFYGGYQTRTDLHYEDGWRDEVIPEFDSTTHVLVDDPYFDIPNDVVTYNIKVIPVEVYTLPQLQTKLKSDLSVEMDEFVSLITRCRMIHENSNEGLNAAVTATLQMRSQTIAAIDAFTDVETAQAFSIKPEDVQYFKSLFEPFKL